jgi:hypothetical protein
MESAWRSRVLKELWIYPFGARMLRSNITPSSLTLLAKTVMQSSLYKRDYVETIFLGIQKCGEDNPETVFMWRA